MSDSRAGYLTDGNISQREVADMATSEPNRKYIQTTSNNTNVFIM